MTWKVPPSPVEWWNDKRPPYTGDLAEPIPVSTDVAGAMRTVSFERLPKLYEHYGIDMRGPDSASHLALALAKAHVPGFQFTQRNKRGRTPNCCVELANLRREVDALVAEGHSKRQAFKRIGSDYGLSPEGARDRYRQATKGKHKEIVDKILDRRARKKCVENSAPKTA